MTHTTTSQPTLADLTNIQETGVAGTRQNLKVLKACGWPSLKAGSHEAWIVYTMLWEHGRLLSSGKTQRLVRCLTGLSLEEADHVMESVGDTLEDHDFPAFPSELQSLKRLIKRGLLGLDDEGRIFRTESGEALNSALPSNLWK